MLRISIPISPEGWDEVNECFVEPTVIELDLEHSLVSLSKWESKWCKPFLNNKELSGEEFLDYIMCMTITPGVDPIVYTRITKETLNQINEYIAAPMTATTFVEEKGGKGGREIVTAELIYYWMVALQIPFECQYWHLNRLITLVRVCNVKNAPPKKMSKNAIKSRNAALNAQRRAQLNSKG